VNKEEIEIELLNNACAQFITSTEDLTRNDALKQFTNVLSEQTEFILSNYMVQGWCKPYVNSQELFETHYSTLEYQKFSPNATMEQIRKLMQLAEREAGRMATAISVKSVMGRLK
jgi:hypothetical protein